MFDITCPAPGHRVLIWTSRLTNIRNLENAIEVDFRCLCGADATLRTGVNVREQLVRHQKRVSFDAA